MKVTHQTIADYLGISRATVTQALHGTRHSNVRPELREQVLKAASELGYRPRGMTTHTIGYVLKTETLKLAGEARLLMLADDAARDAGYRLALATVREQDVQPLQDSLSPKKVDGVLFHRWFGGKIKNLLDPEVPWVVTSDEDGIGPDVDLVTVDTLQSAEILTQYLLERGHERICLVTGPAGMGFHERQKAGVRTALAQANLPETNLQYVEVLRDREISGPLREILAGPEPPTAIIGASPEKTVCIMNLLYHDGYRIPEDISLVSLIDSDLLDPLSPPVTTTSFGEGVSRLAVERLVEKMSAPDSPARQVLVPSSIIERESVAEVAAEVGM